MRHFTSLLVLLFCCTFLEAQDYHFVKSIPFYSPTGVTVDAQDNLYITQFGAFRSGYKITREGVVQTSYTCNNYSNTIAVSSKGLVAVGNEVTGSCYGINFYDTSGTKKSDGLWITTLTMRFGKKDVLYVGRPHGIECYDALDNLRQVGGVSFPQISGEPTLDNVQGIAIDTISNTLYASRRDTIYVIDLNKGKQIKAKLFSPLYKSHGLCLNEKRQLLVADYTNSQVVVMDSLGTILQQIGTNGTGDDQFDLPRHIAVDKSNRMYVTDWNNNRIKVYEHGLLTALDNDKSAIRTKIFPNPAHSSLTVETEREAELRILDLQGEEKWRGAVKNSQTVAVDQLPKGIYVFELSSFGSIKREKVVVY